MMRKLFSLVVVLGLVLVQGFSQNVIVNSNPTMNDRFSKKVGSLRLSTTLLKFGRIKNNASKTDTLIIYNSGNRSMELSLGKMPAHMEAVVGTEELGSGKESWIAVTYHAMKKNDYGYVLDQFVLLTNDSVQPLKTINVSAHIQEYFSPMTADDSLNVQKAKWSETVYDYGKVKTGTKITHNFEVTNEGKRDLVIRKSRSSCTCLKLTAARDTISPGATVFFTLEFDSANKEGKDSRKLHVYLNDPARPEVVMEMKGEIGK
jgi:hypothetical protein